MIAKKTTAKRVVTVEVLVEIGLLLEDLQTTYDEVGRVVLQDALRTACKTLGASWHAKVRVDGEWMYLLLGLPSSISISNFVSQLKRLSTLAVAGTRPGASSKQKMHLWARSYSVRSRDAEPPRAPTKEALAK
jgi:REP element-mobilizing transposase RayT